MKSNAKPDHSPVLFPPGQPINMHGPGTILWDIHKLIDFIGEAGITTSSKLGNLPAECLVRLNDKLVDPIDLKMKRPLLQSYPNIAGLYMLLRVMALVECKGKNISLNTQQISLWQSLNPTEQYFSLMEAWLWHAQGDVIGEERTLWGTQADCLTDFLK